MKQVEMLQALRALGWKCRKDEVGDYFCRQEIGNLQLQIIPTVGKRPGYYRVSFMPSVSTNEFSAAVSFIFGEAKDYMPIIVSNNMPEKIVDFSLNEITRLSQSAMTWASVQDIKKGLAAYRALPTDSKGNRPLCHLAALAIAGEVERLSGYQHSFQHGDKLGFVPYITAGMIDRALLLAGTSKS